VGVEFLARGVVCVALPFPGGRHSRVVWCRIVVVLRRGARDETGPGARASGDVHDSDADAVNA